MTYAASDAGGDGADVLTGLSPLRAVLSSALVALDFNGTLEICIPGTDKGTAIRELISDETAAAFYAGDDVGDLPAVREVNAWLQQIIGGTA
jgi:trehalose-6-phosphatase